MSDTTTTETRRQRAVDALNAYHWHVIRKAVDDIVYDVDRRDIVDSDQLNEAISDWAESLCTYTYTAQMLLIASKHDDDYVSEYGAEGVVQDGRVNWEALAVVAVEADIRDELPDDIYSRLNG